MGFKESVAEDIDTVLFDEEELAEQHSIDGEKMRVVVQSAQMEDVVLVSGAVRSSVNRVEHSVNRSAFLLFIREEDARRLQRKKFTVNAKISFDGKELFVQEVSHTRGLWRLTVGIHTV